ncbi:protein kintoun, partial [Clarias magur]
MDFENKLEELNMTPDEIKRFSKAMKNEKFRELLHEYAEEISNPENKKKYEEEITQLEQERGMEVKFIHPSPHHVLKTSVNRKEKCFINICSNNLINKPSCEARPNEQGQVGQCWSLPYSLTPGRPDRDGRGNKCMIYDVVFHPDTLYMADKNIRFMQLVNRTATQGVEKTFKVTPDKAYKFLKKIQYKGVPQPAVVRKPIPGQPRNKESSMPIENPTFSLSSLTQSSVNQSPSLPIQPHYVVKYRSFVDLQDYRCSRDSAPSPRPKEIIITIDLPLLKTAADVDLNVTERKLTLESLKPNYKLELKLSYPVDSDKGDAKFNKNTKELVITLAVQPAKNPAVGYVEGHQSEIDYGDLIKSPDKADEAQHDAELVTEQTEQQNFSDTCSEAQPQENRPVQEEEKYTHHHYNEDITSNPLHLADATPTSEINNTDRSRSLENAMNMPKHGFLLSSHTCTKDLSVEPHANEENENNQDKDNLPSGTKSVQHSAMAPAVKLEDFTQCSLMDETENGSPLEVAVLELQMKQGATHVDETLQDFQNNPANTSNWLMEKTE